MNTVEFKSATFPNAGSRHLLDDSVMESHSPTRVHAESSTLSSGISLGKTNTYKPFTMLHSLYVLWHVASFLWMICICTQGAVRALSSVKRFLGRLLRGKVTTSVCAVFFPSHPHVQIIKYAPPWCDCMIFLALPSRHSYAKRSSIKTCRVLPRFQPCSQGFHDSSLHRCSQMLLRQPESFKN